MDCIIAHAPRARAAGILRLAFEGVSFELAPADPVAPDAADDDEWEDVEDPNPLHDATTFGGRVPGFRRRPEEHSR